MSEDRLPKEALTYKPRGRMSQGYPLRTWNQQF